MHSGSFNHTDSPRVATFAGWCHRQLYIPSTGPPDITARQDWNVLPLDHPIRQQQLRCNARLGPLFYSPSRCRATATLTPHRDFGRSCGV